jgi:hypothetical protein
MPLARPDARARIETGPAGQSRAAPAPPCRRASLPGTRNPFRRKRQRARDQLAAAGAEDGRARRSRAAGRARMDSPATASPSGHSGALVVVDELTRRSALSPAAARTCPTSQGVGRPSLLSSAASGDSASERICIAHRESTWAWMCVAASDEPSSGSASNRAAAMMKLPERSRNSSTQPQRCRSRRSVSKLWTNWTSLAPTSFGLTKPLPVRQARVPCPNRLRSQTPRSTPRATGARVSARPPP